MYVSLSSRPGGLGIRGSTNSMTGSLKTGMALFGVTHHTAARLTGGSHE